MDLIDIGVNLTNIRLYQQIDDIVHHAKNAGVIHQIITGTSLQTSQQALEMTATYPGYFSCTAGCHPHDAKAFKNSDEQQLIALAENPAVVAIGECGLDFNRNYSPQDMQESVFERQIEIACKVKLPLFMHQRDAHRRFIDILSKYSGHYKGGVIHCFTGDKQQLKDCLDLGLYIGITGWVCDQRRGTKLQDAVKYIPLDRMLLETDAPYLIPRNMQPKSKSNTNVPANITWIVKKLAQLLALSAETVAQKTTINARNFFAVNV